MQFSVQEIQDLEKQNAQEQEEEEAMERGFFSLKSIASSTKVRLEITLLRFPQSTLAAIQ